MIFKFNNKHLPTCDYPISSSLQWFLECLFVVYLSPICSVLPRLPLTITQPQNCATGSKFVWSLGPSLYIETFPINSLFTINIVYFCFSIFTNSFSTIRRKQAQTLFLGQTITQEYCFFCLFNWYMQKTQNTSKNVYYLRPWIAEFSLLTIIWTLKLDASREWNNFHLSTKSKIKEWQNLVCNLETATTIVNETFANVSQIPSN